MRRAPAWSLLLLLAACDARIAAGSHNNVADGGAGDSIDASTVPIDASTADAPLGKFGPATKVTVAATTANEDDATLSSNALEMVFAIDTGTNGKDLYYTSRAMLTSAWTAAVKLPFNSDTKSDETPRFSPDDKTLYFASGRGNTNGNLDIYAVKRDAAGSTTTWGTPAKNMTVSTASTEKWYMPCGTQFLMVQDPGTGAHFVGGQLGSAGVPIPELTAAAGAETGTFFTADCKTLYFASTRTAPTMIYVSHRDTVDSKWQAPTPVTDLTITGGNGDEEDPWMSPDGKIFTFVSDVVTANGKDVYITTR